MEAVQELLRNKSSKSIMVSSFNVFKMKKENRTKQIILYIVALIPSILIGISVQTVGVLTDSLQTILEVVLALFGIVFMGYSFFQALINRELLIRMIQETTYDESNEKEKSKLQETNESFVECMMLNLCSIMLTLLLKIVVSCIPENFQLFHRLEYNNFAAVILISVYFYIIAIVIWEVKSFVFNIFQLFNVYAGTRILGLFKKDDKEGG